MSDQLKGWSWHGSENDEEEWRNHPNNGVLSWWRVQDWKRGYLVHASSAIEAFGKAVDYLVNPSTTTITWIGEELPDVIEATE